MKYNPEYPTGLVPGDFIRFTEARLEGLPHIGIIIGTCDGKTIMINQSIKRWKGKLYHSFYTVLRTPLHFSIEQITQEQVAEIDTEILNDLREKYKTHATTSYPHVMVKGKWIDMVITVEDDFLRLVISNVSESSDRLSLAFFTFPHDAIFITAGNKIKIIKSV